MTNQLTKGLSILTSSVCKGVKQIDGKSIHTFRIEIMVGNKGESIVQLKGISFKLFDSLSFFKGRDEIFIDLKDNPILKSNDSMMKREIYCELPSPFNAIKGYVNAVNLATNKVFRVKFATFQVSSLPSCN